MATENTILPPGIEIFRAGRRTAENGTTYDFSDAVIDEIANSYNPALREAPLVVGHPAANLPAYGWVARAGSKPSADGRVLTMDSRAVEPAFAEMVRTARFPKRSASFYHPSNPNSPTPGKWYLRHVGFLGAQPPAVAGLKDIQFSEGDADGVISFSETAITQKEILMDEETKARLAKAEAEAESAKLAQANAEAATKVAQEQLAEFAEAQRQSRHAAHVSFAEAQVKAGKILPKDKETAVAVLDQLADSQPVEFSEAGVSKKVAPAEWFKGLIEGAKPLVEFGEFAGGDAGGESTKGMSDADIDRRAKAYAAQHNVSYSEALSKVVSFTS